MDRTVKQIAWLVPPLLEGSGGHRTIFQNVNALIRRRYDCHVYIETEQAQQHVTARAVQEARAEVTRFFGETDAKIHLGFDIREPFDLVFATVWYTANIVRNLHIPCKKAYFIQDFEPLFHPMGDGFLMAENSYRLGLRPITIGNWLAHKMSHEFGAPAASFEFCADQRTYYADPRVKREKAVCFIWQPEKPRRCAQIGIEALGILKHHRPDVQIYLYGSRRPLTTWFPSTNLGLQCLDACADLYRRCSVGFCISSSNPSRIPFEMMAAGLPVVDLYRENNLYDMPEGAVLLAHQEPEALSRALMMVLDDASLRDQMSARALEFMRDRDLSTGYQQFVTAVELIMADRFPGDTHIEPIYWREPVLSEQRDHISAAAASLVAISRRMEASQLELEIARRLRASMEIDAIENTRAWRLLQTAKRMLRYRPLMRSRRASVSENRDPVEDPLARLLRIKATRSYRLIQAAKRTKLYKCYYRLRYGIAFGWLLL